MTLCIPSVLDMQRPKRAGDMGLLDKEGKDGWVQR